MWCLKGRVELKASVDDRSGEIFCLLLYVCKCKTESLILYRAADSAAAVMIHMHAGKTRPCTQVLPLSSPVLPAPITHAYCTLTHTNTRVPCLKCSMQLWHWHMPYLCISIKNTGHVVSQLCKWEQPTYGDHACIWVSESKAIFSEDIINDKPLDLIILVILLHWAQGRHLFPIPKASSLAPNTKGYFRWML